MKTYDDAALAAAAAGPHGGWSTFDISQEGVRLQALQDLVSAPVFDAGAADEVLGELKGLARSYGYGTADGFLTDTAGMTDDEIEADHVRAIQRDALFGDSRDDYYFFALAESASSIASAAASDEAREWSKTADLRATMDRSYVEGAETRRDQDPKNGAVPGF